MPRVSYLSAAILAAVIGIASAASHPASAQDSTLDNAQKEAVDGIAKLLQALDLFVKSVPQFASPEVLPNGDIILRRIHPDQKPAPEHPKDDDDSSST